MYRPYTIGCPGKPPPGAPVNPHAAGGLENRLELDLICNEGAGGLVRDYSHNQLQQIFKASALSPAAHPCPKWAKGPDGPVLNFGAGGAFELNYFRKGINRFADTSAAYTFMAYAMTTSASGSMGIVQIGERTDSNDCLALGIDAIDNALAIGQDFDKASSAPLVPTAGKWFVGGISQSSITARTFFLDGQTIANTNSISGAIGATQPIVIGTQYANALETTADRWVGMIGWVRVWSRALSVPEMVAVMRDPYWRFRFPVSCQSCIATGGGGASGLLLRRRRMAMAA